MKSVGNIITHYAYGGSEPFIKNLIEVILTGFTDNTTIVESSPYLHALERILLIPDSLLEQKFEWCFGFPEPKKLGSDNDQTQMEQFGTYGGKYQNLAQTHLTFYGTFYVENCKSLL